MTTFVSRPVEIEAMQWDQHGSIGSSGSNGPVFGYTADEIVAWVNAKGGEARYDPKTYEGPLVLVRTKNDGFKAVKPGWWVIKGGEWFHAPAPADHHSPTIARLDHYPCDPDTFAKRWERKP